MSRNKKWSILLIGLFGLLGEYSPADALGYFISRQYMEPCENGYGVCMSSIECRIQKGRTLGACALGTCCRIEKTCNDVITTNNTFFVNPSEIRPGSSCVVDVEKKWALESVCQMRLDLLKFEMGPANALSGICLHDAFTVVGVDRPVPTICGRNDRQHLYVDVRNSRSIQLMVNLGANSTTRRWKIRVTQIPCTSQRLAPTGCLQYFEDSTGYLKSFGYDPVAESSTYPLGLSYFMCFREPCQLQLSQVGPFELGEKADQNPANSIQDVQVDAGCTVPTDPNVEARAYIQIDNKTQYWLSTSFHLCANETVRKIRFSKVSTFNTNKPVPQLTVHFLLIQLPNLDQRLRSRYLYPSRNNK
ncbi:uncharacterized protein LOC111270701 isoform X2 [Varroa jacobsoni]|uniref:uncharacterized protein LOC111270701 isoform X2 n=1 Tax=Varroa jacobsoni TaxID=62625 RepID=UPI000BF9CE08|nr:uncharacterized protein LOC111270701 isoform X2 [Varroa jacobsoni]